MTKGILDRLLIYAKLKEDIVVSRRELDKQAINTQICAGAVSARAR